jgi:hypothetical protein
MHMTAPVSDGTFSVVRVSSRNQQIPASAPGRSGDDDERIEPGLEVNHDQEIHQQDRSDQAEAESDERRAHGHHLPADHDAGPTREFVVEGLDHFEGIGGNRPEVAVLGAGVNVDDGLHVVVVHGSGACDGSHLRQVA